MKYAFTLVELIFSIVIIAIVFTVIPRLMFVTTKTMEQSIKEDGLFAGLALMGNIIRLPWSEEVIRTGGKIDTSTGDCDASGTGYRVGGFIGSRNCLNPLSLDVGSPSDKNDIDDYNGYTSTTQNGRIQYDLNVKVRLNGNIKVIDVNVTSTSKTKLCSSFFYNSANLGHVQINKRTWQ